MFVSIHAPTRGATRRSASSARQSSFQFTRPRGARLFRIWFWDYACCFNSRAHEGRDRAVDKLHQHVARFNSRAHEGRDIAVNAERRDCDVSIHAPTRGATVLDERGVIGCGVSIHAPTRGATPRRHGFPLRVSFQFTRPRGARPSPPATQIPAGRFQFTRPRGARRGRGADVQIPDRVSIHAPTRGATRGCKRHWAAPQFQFTRPRGARHRQGIFVRNVVQFQFTRPRGARLPGHLVRREVQRVSIHAPTRGATFSTIFGSISQMFQFTRPRGARRRRRPIGSRASAFQFTRPRGARPDAADLLARIPVSIHAPTRGATTALRLS